MRAIEWLHAHFDLPSLVAVAPAIAFFMLSLRRSRDERWGHFTLGAALLAMGVAARWLGGHDFWWAWIIAFVPGVVIVEQAVTLAFVRAPLLAVGASYDGEDEETRDRLRAVASKARAKASRYFSIDTLALRYGAAAIIIVALNVTLFFALRPKDGYLPRNYSGYGELIRCAQYGAAGAYCYVLLSLGERRFRHDITPGAAVWSAVTLILGPILACVVNKVFVKAGDPANGALYFLAGIAPRHVAHTIQEVARRLTPAGEAKAAAARLTPLSSLRGVTPALEERLAEEGIYDVNGMALADPIRLMRNTPFDRRQIVGWIDEALLVVALPESWSALERLGITGAIDLAWMRRFLSKGEHGSGDPLAPDDAPVTERDPIARLAENANIPRTALAATILRFSEDTQVNLVWVLYQNEGQGQRTRGAYDDDELDADEDGEPDRRLTGIRLASLSPAPVTFAVINDANVCVASGTLRSPGLFGTRPRWIHGNLGAGFQFTVANAGGETFTGRVTTADVHMATPRDPVQLPLDAAFAGAPEIVILECRS